MQRYFSKEDGGLRPDLAELVVRYFKEKDLEARKDLILKTVEVLKIDSSGRPRTQYQSSRHAMNKITDNLKLGTIGELLVQLRLLEFDVQAAPPLKDSGNDLIAIRGIDMRAIQVKQCDFDDRP